MATFHGLLDQLSAEHERLERSLAEAQAELRARRAVEVRRRTVDSVSSSGSPRNGKVVVWQYERTTHAPAGCSRDGGRQRGGRTRDAVSEQEEEEEGAEDEEGWEERGVTWSRAPTLREDERQSMEMVADEGPGLSVAPDYRSGGWPHGDVSARSRGASGPPAPARFCRTATDSSLAEKTHKSNAQWRPSQMPPLPPSGMSEAEVRRQATGESVITQNTWQTYMTAREFHSSRHSVSQIVKQATRKYESDADDTGRCTSGSSRRSYTRTYVSEARPRHTWGGLVSHIWRLVPGMSAADSLMRNHSASLVFGCCRDDSVPTSRRRIRDFQVSGSRWVVNPEHSFALEKWDQITLFALAFVALVTPCQVSMMETKVDAMLFVNCVIDSIFFCDMILQFFLMYPQRTNYGCALEHRHSKIIVHYLKTYFVIDLLSIIPFDLFAVLSNSEGLQQLKIVKAVRLMRLLKLIRVLKASRVFNRFETRMSITYGRLALLKFFVILFVITHWLANLWALTLVIVDETEGVPRWVDVLTDLEANVDVKTKDSPPKLYIACLYFTSYTITSVGFGDISPRNIVERVVLTFIIIVAGISWAVVLGQVCGIVGNLDKDEQAFRSTMDELNAMIEDRRIPTSMRTRLRSFFLSNKTAQKRARHLNIVTAMSPGLRAEVTWEINRFWLEKIRFLRPLLEEAELHHDAGFGMSLRSFVLDTSLMMEQEVRAQSEVFGVPHTMYILNRGLATRRKRLCNSGCVWGADFVLSDRRLLEPVESFALTYIELTTLRRHNFFDLVQRHSRSFPEIYRTVRRFCCWLAFQRALMLEARRRQGAFRGNKKDTMAPLPSLTGARPFPTPPAPPLTP